MESGHHEGSGHSTGVTGQSVHPIPAPETGHTSQEASTSVHHANAFERALEDVRHAGLSKAPTDDASIGASMGMPLKYAAVPTLEILQHVVRDCVIPNTAQCTQCSIHYSMTHGFRMIMFSGTRLSVRISRMAARIQETVGSPVEIRGSQTKINTPATWTVHWWEDSLHEHVSSCNKHVKSKHENHAEQQLITRNTAQLSTVTRSIGWTSHTRCAVHVGRGSNGIRLESPAGWDVRVNGEQTFLPGLDAVVLAEHSCLEFELSGELEI